MLSNDEKQSAARNLKYKAAAERVQQISASYDFVFVKGISLLHKKIYSITERLLTDIDIIVKPNQYNAFVNNLKTAGFSVFSPRSKANETVLTFNGVNIDIHNTAFNYEEFPFNGFMRLRYMDFIIEYRDDHLLDNETEFVFIALHSLFSLMRRPYWAEDVIRLSARVDTRLVDKYSRELGFENAFSRIVGIAEEPRGQQLACARYLFANADSRLFFIQKFISQSKNILEGKGYNNRLNYIIKLVNDLRKPPSVPKI